MNYKKLQEYFEEKARIREEKRNKLYTKIKENINSLNKKYPEIKRIFLFGSILKKAKFFSNSDVDFAVEGLKGENYFALFSDLEDLCRREIQLIELENCRETLKKHIIEKGEVIYERRYS